jgi:hypothetical protein
MGDGADEEAEAEQACAHATWESRAPTRGVDCPSGPWPTVHLEKEGRGEGEGRERERERGRGRGRGRGERERERERGW